MSVPSYDTYQPFCNDDAVSIAKTQNTQKKPRHRHSPHQLAALNELFEQNEHPPLEQRSALAHRLGMETKTVNAWFQNKRASSKKRVRGGPASHKPHNTNNRSIASKSTAQSAQHQQPLKAPRPDDLKASPSDSAKHSASKHPENTAHDLRHRLSEEQSEELRKLFTINSHPTPEDRHVYSASLGMTYEKVTNWFQNQRYLAKKKREDEDESHWHAKVDCSEARQYLGFQPPSSGLPLPKSHSSLGQCSTLQSSRSISPLIEDRSPRRSSSRIGASPYCNAHPSFARTRRSRPEPYQLVALQRLFRKTATPTIEERSALAHEIGMDIGKVTNWFRNLRQTARRRAKKSSCSGEEDDDDGFHPDPYSVSSSVSRSGTPSLGSPEFFIKGEDSMDVVDFNDHRPGYSVDNSDDEYQEAVTPPPEPSPSPQPGTISSQPMSVDGKLEILLSHLPYPIEIDKASAERFPGIRMEDALLLLSFHHHIVQY